MWISTRREGKESTLLSQTTATILDSKEKAFMKSDPNHPELGITGITGITCPAGLSVERELQGLITQVMCKADLKSESTST